MAENHTKQVMNELNSLLRKRRGSRSPMTSAAAALDMSYITLARRIRKGTLTMSEFEQLAEFIGIDPSALYSAPEQVHKMKLSERLEGEEDEPSAETA